MGIPCIPHDWLVLPSAFDKTANSEQLTSEYLRGMSTEAAGKIAAQSVREAHQHQPRVRYVPIEKKTEEDRRNVGTQAKEVMSVIWQRTTTRQGGPQTHQRSLFTILRARPKHTLPLVECCQPLQTTGDDHWQVELAHGF